ncbi:carboxymethylenebutenolidase [Kluyveromyces lactis]|uniref:KLLA0F07381p n=1 Tax=Kluyveromyces lactis (strain ATCC 8585 / CBS 2359 / DSM 70799 / NBRC 1267 / NRRL Y-1140 / WM37) TaxID=284590 RepID=Q6CKX4_KLULA|nr:uncharacterized protein KLLA0_F07381g [Kluyveromyces lactis]CAG98123.1 KLLA0F07381p [Kluyveromyces lactis]|eukprot:XP_455415.1 uncharacterized protein KLLA0_F07381g [Kluyveromyces lactis]
MLIEQCHQDLPTSFDSEIRIHIVKPTVKGYPNAKFPAVLVFSEIYQVTGPVLRFAQTIAAEGYIAILPSSYHNFVDSTPLAYDTEGTDLGNKFKIEKPLESYDEDVTLCLDVLENLPQWNGRVGATGMCLGGHLAFRAQLDSRIKATTCFFPTDIHSHSLGLGKNDDSLEKVTANWKKDQECFLIFGTKDTHVPWEGRDQIRNAVKDKSVTFLEINGAQHAFIRDEFSKGRFDSAVTKACLGFMFELFDRKLKSELGEFVDDNAPVEHVC